MVSNSPLIVVDIDRTGAFPAEQLAFALGFEKAEVVDSASDAINLLSAPSGLRYVVADIGLHGEDMFPVLSSLAKACGNNAPLVVVGNINDLGFYRNLKNLGAYEYFTHPASVTEVRAALTRSAAADRRHEDRMKSGSVIAFMSAASGDGASTVALNTAYALEQETHAQTVLADFDYQFGMVARHLDLQPQFGIREVFDYPDRGVDATLVSKMLLQYGSSKLNIISAPEALHMLPGIRQESVRDLIGVLKSQFTYTVVDVPHVWLPWTAEVLAQADRIVVVGQLWLRSLTHLSRLLAAMSEAGINRDKVWVAVNRSGARFREAITPQDFERVCLKNISFYFANDIKTVVGAENQGKTLLEIGSSLLERQMREIARALSGMQAQPASAESEEAAGDARKGGLRGLFHKS